MTIDPSAVTEAGAGGDAAAALGPGASIGKYRLDRVLGEGGMGVVWAAFDPDLERPVAIKLLRAADGSAAMRTRLLREARAMARLKHPNVLTVYEVGTDRNRDYIAMELIDGMDLDRWLVSRPPRDEVLAALFAAGRGLAAAHGAGLIHRDLKPHNILRGRDGGVYVTDFGLARGQIEDGPEVVQAPVAYAATAVGSQPRATDSVLDSPLTQTGVLIGTPAYMAPEQFAGRAPDPRSDQFAFCVTAWEALTGARPFSGHNLEELRAAASAGAPGAAQVSEAVLPPRLRAVLARGLSPDPADRWPDMHAMLDALQSALAPRTARVPRIAWITLAVLAVIGFLTGVALYTRSHTAPNVVAPVVPAPPPVPAPPSIPGPGPRPHLAAGCKPPDQAFGGAWSAERRAAVVARHRASHELLPASAALDEVRHAWIRGYEAACAMPESEARHEQLDCLLEAREAIDEATRELTEEDSSLSLATLIPLNVVVSACTHE
ncbi:MAG TPA: serine/threonine-protein kinase [Kofleriaceae bacterium]